jgi:ADP-ribose pyrophosphatase YjhB (NUDIX family)
MAEHRIMIGVGAIIEDGAGRILLVKHIPERGGFWQGKWICPGGELELGESIEEGIKREVSEETQLEIDLVSPLHPFDTIVISNNEIALHVIYIDYLAKLIGGELKPGSDVAEAMWVEKERLPQIWEELHDDTKRLLRIAGIIDASSALPSNKKVTDY